MCEDTHSLRQYSVDWDRFWYLGALGCLHVLNPEIITCCNCYIISSHGALIVWNEALLLNSSRCCYAWCLIWSGPWFNIKMSSYQYRKSHCGDKTILRPSYLHNGISYTGKMSSLYWIGAQYPLCAHYSAIGFKLLCHIKKRHTHMEIV